METCTNEGPGVIDKGIKKNPWFWLFLFIKLSLFAVIPSQVATGLFIPFLDNAILDPLSNPWSFFPANYFPYGSVLFLLMIIPKALLYMVFGYAALGQTLISIIALKLPILFADLSFLYLLLKFPTSRDKKWLFMLYWMSPVLLFINYVHTQLDIFAVLFVFVSLHFVRTKREILSAVALALAILCKFHVAILAPLFMAYFWRTKFKDEAFSFLLRWTSTLGILVLIGFMPHLLSSHLGYISIMSPEAQKIFSLSFTLDGQNQLYVGFGIVVAVLVRLLLSSRITEQGLIYSSGVLLGLLIITTSSMPGWYYWIYPFLALFLSQYMVRLQSILIASYFFYLFHFIPIQFEWPVPQIFSTISFTLLQMSLLGLILAMWFFVVRFEMPWLRRSRPLLIGIAGDSGAGKNTLSQTLFDLFGNEATSLVEGDDYHKWERGSHKWSDYTHLNPRANYLETLSRHVFMLLQGRPVYKSHYDHTLGQFTDERLIRTQKNIIVQGLHAFYPILLRKMMDIKIYVSPHEQLRLFWKLKRDQSERGHTPEQILKSVQSRQYDSLLHITPQKHHADWIVEYFPVDPKFTAAPESANTVGSDPEIYQIHRIVNDTPLELLMSELSKIPTIQVFCESDVEDFDFLKVEVRGKISAEQVEDIAHRAFGAIRHLTRSHSRPLWHGNLDGVTQLLFLAMMQRTDNPT